jgi:hypothetical protein
MDEGSRGLTRASQHKKTGTRLAAVVPVEGLERSRYWMGTAAAGVGAPDALIAVTAAVCWKIVCVSAVPKYRPPVLAEIGAASAKYVGRSVDPADPVQAAAAPVTAEPVPARVTLYPLFATVLPLAGTRSGLMNGWPLAGAVPSSVNVGA